MILMIYVQDHSKRNASVAFAGFLCVPAMGRGMRARDGQRQTKNPALPLPKQQACTHDTSTPSTATKSGDPPVKKGPPCFGSTKRALKLTPIEEYPSDTWSRAGPSRIPRNALTLRTWSCIHDSERVSPQSRQGARSTTLRIHSDQVSPRSRLGARSSTHRIRKSRRSERVSPQSRQGARSTTLRIHSDQVSPRSRLGARSSTHRIRKPLQLLRFRQDRHSSSPRPPVAQCRRRAPTIMNSAPKLGRYGIMGRHLNLSRKVPQVRFTLL